MTDKNKVRKHKSNKTKKLFRTMVCSIIFQILSLIRYCVDAVIDFAFSCYWCSKKQETPPLQKDSFITKSAVSIARQIKEGELSSEQVVLAYINRIKEVNRVINAITDSRFEKAIEEARAIDCKLKNKEYSDEELKQKPFLGVPFTTKDSTAVGGCLHTLGLICRRNMQAETDAEVVRLSVEAGGIVLGVTNVPEVNRWQETYNNLFGLTKNPYDTTRTTGGSSGGEAAIVSACGSAWGLGTDIGGSIRMPAFYCGLYGHKPTSSLTNMKGCTFRTGQESKTMVQAGPLTRHAEDLIPLLKVLVADKVNQLKLDTEVDLSKLKVYYMEESHDIRCSSVSKPLKEALKKAIHGLETKCDQAKQVSIEGVEYSFKLWRYWMTKEPSDFASLLNNGEGRANGFQELMKKVIGQSDYTMASIMSLLDSCLKPENAKWAEELTEKMKLHFMELLGTDGVFIYPSTTFTAPYHYSAFLRPYNFSYWGIFNVLHLPVTQVPLGLDADGLPLGIQVVAAPFNDHLTIAVAKELENMFGGWVPPFKLIA